MNNLNKRATSAATSGHHHHHQQQQQAQLSRRDESQKLFECPVCVQIFKNPKLLPCGHSICCECCNQLNRERIHLLCPVCRRPAHVSAENLPINFGLRDLVQHHLDTMELKKFTCVSCDQRISVGDCWSCQDCRSVICSQCALKNHKSHPLKEITEMLRDKEHELTEWRENLTKVDQDVAGVRRQIEVNQVRLVQCGQQLVQTTLWKHLSPQLDTESKTLKQELLGIQKRYRDVNAARLITDEATGRESDFVSLPADFASLAEKQEKLLKRQNEALAALRKCDASLTALLAPNARRAGYTPCPSLTLRYSNLASCGGNHNWRFFHRPIPRAPEVINVADSDEPLAPPPPMPPIANNPSHLNGGGRVSSSAASVFQNFDDTSDDDTEPEADPLTARVRLNYLMDTSEPASGGVSSAPANHLSTLHIPQERQAISDDENVAVSYDSANESTESRLERFLSSTRDRIFDEYLTRNRDRRFQLSKNGDRVVTVDEDSLDEMDIAPSTSSDVREIVGVSTDGGAERVAAGPSNKTSTAPKRGRTTTSSQASNATDSDDDEQQDPVDSTIRFRILRKYDRNN